MSKSTIIKILNKLKSGFYVEYSLGFRRLSVLPAKTRLSFDLASNLKTNWDGLKARELQKNFLASLTEEEFVNWLKFNA